MLRLLHPLLVVVLSVAIPAAAAAQAMSVQQLNEAGLQAFAEGRHLEAAELFQRAYDDEPRPELLKNEAVAWYQAHRCHKALDVAHRFLQADGLDDRERREVELLVGACRVRLAKHALAAGDDDLAAGLLDRAQDVGPDPALADRIDATRLAIVDHRRQDELSMRQSFGWTMVGVGALTIAAGGIYHAYTLSETEPELAEAGRQGDRARYDDLQGELRTANWLVPTLYAVGVATGGGGLWIALDTPDPKPDASAGVTVGFRTRF